MHRHVLYWYHFYLNHLGGSRLENTIRQVCYWKVLVSHAELSVKTCKKFQHFKNRKTIYEQLKTRIITALKLCN